MAKAKKTDKKVDKKAEVKEKAPVVTRGEYTKRGK
tara:strand:+ start:371 stop:475 length:105 start_codon:yes stop_codon:yes gene_type:complete